MRAATRTDRGAIDGGFLTLVIEALGRSAALADQHARYGQHGERSRGAMLRPAARRRAPESARARSLDAPVVPTLASNRNVSAKPTREPLILAPLAESAVIMDSVRGRNER